MTRIGPPKQPTVPVERLYRAADLGRLSFETTEELEPIDGIMAQSRALDVIRRGAEINRFGFDIFAIGRLCSILCALDSELGEHFKVLADFDDDVDRSAESEALLARLRPDQAGSAEMWI